MNKLSVFIITKNEESRLARTLGAARLVADEIVVVDSRSTDATRDLAEGFGARVLERPFDGYGPQKVYAQNACSNDWLLNLDADEVLNQDLINALLAWKARPPKFRGYYIDVLTVYPGDTKPRLFANDYRLLRLYDRRAMSYRNHPIYDRVEPAPGEKLGRLKGCAYHFTVINTQQMIQKFNDLTDFQAGEMSARNVAILKLRTWFEFPTIFLKTYFLRCHFTGGRKGFIHSLNMAYFRTMRLEKYLEHVEAGSKST